MELAVAKHHNNPVVVRPGDRVVAGDLLASAVDIHPLLRHVVRVLSACDGVLSYRNQFLSRL